jgi:hypothetical protein
VGSSGLGSQHPAGVAGNRFLKHRKFADAVTAYTEAIRAQPTQPEWYHNRALARASLGDYRGALEDAWRSAEALPNGTSARDLIDLLQPNRRPTPLPEARVGSTGSETPFGDENDPFCPPSEVGLRRLRNGTLPPPDVLASLIAGDSDGDRSVENR